MNSSNSSLTSAQDRAAWVPLLELAAREVFEMMLGSHLTVSPDPVVDDNLDITAMVGLAGKICGMLSIRCTAKSAAQIASKMLGVDPEKAGPEMWDAIGEVSNMVAGNFKNKISGLGDGCMLSVPTVITGKDYSMHSLADSGMLRSNMLFEESPVVISLEVHS
jgi:chemotaxis protein CheX